MNYFIIYLIEIYTQIQKKLDYNIQQIDQMMMMIYLFLNIVILCNQKNIIRLKLKCGGQDEVVTEPKQ